MAERLGVAPSRFDGREPEAVTQYHYSRKGVLLCAITTRQSEWTDQDREEMLALAEYRAGMCPNGCGHPLSETTTHEDTGPAYNAHRKTCRACAVRLESVRASDDNGGGDSRARIWWISKDDRG